MSMLKFLEAFASNRRLIDAQVDTFNGRRVPIATDVHDEAGASGIGALGATVGADVLQMMADLRAVEGADPRGITEETDGKAEVAIDISSHKT